MSFATPRAAAAMPPRAMSAADADEPLRRQPSEAATP